LLLAACPIYALCQPAPSLDWHSGKTRLDMGWRTHSGDDLAWRAANFDDSAWAPFSFSRAEHDVISAAPVWQWYRLRLHLPATGQPLSLLVRGVRGEFEVYLNGVLQPGSRLASPFALAHACDMVFPLDIPGGDVELAVRTRVPALFYSTPPLVSLSFGTRDALAAQAAAENKAPLETFILPEAIYLLLVLAGVGIFGLYRAQPTHREYLWLSLCLLSLGVDQALWNASETAGLLPLSINTYIADPLTYAWLVTQIEFVYSFAGLKPPRAVRAYEALCLLVPLCSNFGTLFFPISWVVIDPVEALVVLPVALGLPILLTLWYRRGNREAGWLIFPILLTALADVTINVGYTLGMLGLFPYRHDLIPPFQLGPYQLDNMSISYLLFLVSITIVIFLRFTRVSRDQSRIQAELSAAQELQSRLVPTTPPAVPGFEFQAIYLPAAEVGGDFYQVLEETDSSAVIVIGDVSGKGLKAAMTGALVIGALRTLAAEPLAPAMLLGKLNRQLAHANDGGFVTCVCARLAPSGAITLANAGHLAPYRNGSELSGEFGLPLGITADAEYTETTLQLGPGDTLTFLSDGVVEAQAASGELFGFDRTRAISQHPAAQIAAAAQRFGQQDDITVLTLTFAPAEVLHA
jgi:phosphoserine phosphatase RsbU/P